MSVLFIVSGPSGAGKSSLSQRLVSECADLEVSVSYSTRAPRGQERDGEHYHFVDPAEFQRMVGDGEFAEWAEVHGNFYGTSRARVDAALSSGRSLLFDIDYQGAESLLSSYPTHAVATMVLPPNMRVLEDRLRGRGTDAEDVVARRMSIARSEIARTSYFDHVLVNDDFDLAYVELRAIYTASLAKTEIAWPAIAKRFDLEVEENPTGAADS